MFIRGLLSLVGVLEPSLPDHCEPANAFLYHISTTLNICVPSNLALLSSVLGSISIVAWLCAQLPQIWKNFKLHSTSGLSVFFLGEWLLGDASNLLGCIFTRQASWQIVIATYYCFVDCMLMGQYIWYEGLHHGRRTRRVWWPKRRSTDYDGDSDVIDGMSIYSQSTLEGDSSSVKSKPIDTPGADRLRPGDIRGQFRMPRFSSLGSPSSSLGSTHARTTRIPTGTSPMPSPRTILYVSLVLAIAARASPVQLQDNPNVRTKSAIEVAGTVLSWMSTFLYLGSRLPQLYKNHKRRSTAGLSPALFIAAFFGNLFYSSSLLSNPCAWYDFEAYGGGGWVDENGSNRAEWVARATPFFLGAAGVLIMDACVGLQFLYFGEQTPSPIIVVEERSGRKWRWRKVNGWMRGWMPSVSVAGTPRPGSPAVRASEPGSLGEREALLASAGIERAYGGA